MNMFLVTDYRIERFDSEFRIAGLHHCRVRYHDIVFATMTGA